MEKNLIIKCKGSDVANIDDLLEYQGNLKDLTETNYKMLRSRIEKAFRHPIQIWIKPDGNKYIMDGHQRLRVLNKMREDGWNIPAIPICEVFAETEAEAAEIVLESIAQYGIVTADGLLDFTQKYELEIEQVKLDFRFADLNLNLFLEELKEEPEDETYTRKIEAPEYIPKKDKAPEINELYNIEKTNSLIKKINELNINKDIKEFLIYTAYRHIIFDYSNIAEFYCHQDKKIKDIMEDLALIIIDFNKAINQGYVSLSKDIAKQYTEDETDIDNYGVDNE